MGTVIDLPTTQMLREASEEEFLALWKHATDIGDVAGMLHCQREAERRSRAKAEESERQYEAWRATNPPVCLIEYGPPEGEHFTWPDGGPRAA